MVDPEDLRDAGMKKSFMRYPLEIGVNSYPKNGYRLVSWEVSGRREQLMQAKNSGHSILLQIFVDNC